MFKSGCCRFVCRKESGREIFLLKSLSFSQQGVKEKHVLCMEKKMKVRRESHLETTTSLTHTLPQSLRCVMTQRHCLEKGRCEGVKLPLASSRFPITSDILIYFRLSSMNQCANRKTFPAAKGSTSSKQLYFHRIPGEILT